jgi:hypothetical protein
MATKQTPRHRDETVPGEEGTRRSNNQPPQQMQAVTARRLALLANGYLPLPVSGKEVYLKGWTKVVATEEMIHGWERERIGATAAY